MQMGPSRPPPISPVMKTPHHNVFALAEKHSSPPPFPLPQTPAKKPTAYVGAPTNPRYRFTVYTKSGGPSAGKEASVF